MPSSDGLPTEPADRRITRRRLAAPLPTGTRPISHAADDTDLPANPRRLGVLDTGKLDAAVTLGIPPVGAVEAIPVQGLPSYLDRIEGIEEPVDELSGGQRQRAWTAVELAQETEILLLDEPTTFLDLAHQREVLQLLRRLSERAGRTIEMVVHDLNHAARFAHHVVAMSGVQVHMAGTPREVITPRTLREVFGVAAHIIPDPESRFPLCMPYGLCAGPGSTSEREPDLAGGTTYAGA